MKGQSAIGYLDNTAVFDRDLRPAPEAYRYNTEPPTGRRVALGAYALLRALKHTVLASVLQVVAVLAVRVRAGSVGVRWRVTGQPRESSCPGMVRKLYCCC
jgi:hypothetical protein